MTYNPKIAKRFRGFLPVVVDVETGGLDAAINPVLEIAATTLNCDDKFNFSPHETIHFHVEPFKGCKIEQESLEINKIDPDHPFRFAISEEQASKKLYDFLQPVLEVTGCSRCVLVGHNAWFDLSFVNAMFNRAKMKKKLFHSFTSIDTATLGAFVYGHTVLATLLKRAKIEFDPSNHHSALYDTTKTAELFCKMINQQQFSKTLEAV